ncbi:MAG TPA: MFS transporter [Candidatus Acidoferrum sp.]|nr:MFS transporter [Candidatus Acidoferrum sp.]
MSDSPAIRKSFLSFFPPVLLIAVACLINYVDRGNLSIAASTIQTELHITTGNLGVLLAAFFYAYTAFIFISGWLVDRFSANWIFVFGFALWSLATAATGLVHGFVMLLFMRLILGAGESVIFPCSCKVIASFVPERFRGVSNGLMTAGMKSGPAVGALGTGLLMAKYGWRPVFIGIGLISLLWIPAWIWTTSGRVTLARHDKTTSTSALAILHQRCFWFPTAGHFCSNYVMYFMVTWLPFYLQHERGLSLKEMTFVAAAFYACDSLGALSTGWITDLLVRSGRSQPRVRKFSMAFGGVLAAIMLVGCALAGPRTYFYWLIALGLSSGTNGWGPLAFAQTFAGSGAAGKWTGLQNGFANFSGMFSPMITGFLVQWTGRFAAPLGLAAFVAILGALSWISVADSSDAIISRQCHRAGQETALPSAESN